MKTFNLKLLSVKENNFYDFEVQSFRNKIWDCYFIVRRLI